MAADTQQGADNRRQRRYRIHHLLDLLGVISWLLNRGIRGRALREPRPLRLRGEPPLESLDRLAAEGLREAAPRRIKDHNTLRLALELLAEVARLDGDISPEETALAMQFIRDYGPEGIGDGEVEEFIRLFTGWSGEGFHLKNSCFLLREWLDPRQLRLLLNTVYRLLYLHGVEQEENRVIIRIGEYLGFSPSDIRLATSAARREREGGG